MRDYETPLTQQALKEIITYDHETGIFRWINMRRGWADLSGKKAGYKEVKGYIVIQINEFQYKAHRLAWLYFYGAWPSNQIDHINGDKTNNQICNLREATTIENCRNTGAKSTNTSGFKGVFYIKQRAKRPWQASVCIKGKMIYLGSFSTAEEASLAYEAAAKERFGVFYKAPLG
jgi:hypothetical protein